MALGEDEGEVSVDTVRDLAGLIVGVETRINERFDEMEARVNARFDGVHARLDGIDARLDGIEGAVVYLAGQAGDRVVAEVKKRVAVG
ncbi:MAG: hypothetical protein OXN92_00895 [Gammaproteobacteria bacterium]|nr:hypothetical protein [Gammaproteobacteria bacterium]